MKNANFTALSLVAVAKPLFHFNFCSYVRSRKSQHSLSGVLSVRTHFRRPQLHLRQEGEFLESVGQEPAVGERQRLAQDHHAGVQRLQERHFLSINQPAKRFPGLSKHVKLN